MAHSIDMIEGSSIAPDVIARVQAIAAEHQRVLVCLDSNHTHEHVLAELEAYAPLTTVGSYCVVFDTLIEDMPADMFPDRPWGPGNNPKTAVHEYLKTHPEFEVEALIGVPARVGVLRLPGSAGVPARHGTKSGRDARAPRGGQIDDQGRGRQEHSA